VLGAALRQGEPWSRTNAGIYHVTGAGEASWFDLASFVFERARRGGLPLKVQSVNPIPSTAFPTPAQRPLNSRLDGTKFRNTFGLQPKPWEDAVAKIVDELTP